MILSSVRGAAREALRLLLPAAAVLAVLLTLMRCDRAPDPLPAQVARQDEKAAGRSAEAIGVDTARQTEASTISIDLVTKEVRDAFDAIPAVPVPVAGDPAPPLPAAPVDRLRDRLNEGVARANRAAGTTGPTG